MIQFSVPQPLLKTIKITGLGFVMAFAVLYASSVGSYAQATLSIQGIVKKSNGVALEDNVYQMTFKLYTVTMPPSNIVIWDETIPNVEVISGIYSVILGANPSSPITAPFNADYELGVTIGSQEMLPRVRLTSAPYALSLRGQSNQFPSTGQVLADEILVAQGVLASGGAPGLNGVDKNGYAFSGNNGDNDSGLFSTQDGKVSLYTNNVEKVSVTPTEITLNGTTTVQGTLGANNINLFNNGGINYSTTNGGSYLGWRLAQVDDFTSNSQGWNVYSPMGGQIIGWNQGSSAGSCPIANFGLFAGEVLYPGDNKQVLKKQYNIPGTFSQIKVKFRYYFIDGVDWNLNDRAFAGFATQVNGSDLKVAWHSLPVRIGANWATDNPSFQNATNFINGGQNNGMGDYWEDVEMTAKSAGSLFYVFIGSTLDQETQDERYAVGQIEIWVR